MFLVIGLAGKILIQNSAMIGHFSTSLLIGPFFAMIGHVFRFYT